MTALQQAARWIGQARRMIFLGGAGVSTLSGIPDFRSAGGISEDFETILSHAYFMEHPAEFYSFYRRSMVHPEAKPNLVHRTLAQWERAGPASGSDHPEYRWASSSGRQPTGAGAARLCPAQPLHELRPGPMVWNR